MFVGDLYSALMPDGNVPFQPGPVMAKSAAAVPVVRFDGKVVAALNIGVHPEQTSAKIMIGDYAPLLKKEAAAVKERLV